MGDDNKIQDTKLTSEVNNHFICIYTKLHLLLADEDLHGHVVGPKLRIMVVEMLLLILTEVKVPSTPGYRIHTYTYHHYMVW